MSLPFLKGAVIMTDEKKRELKADVEMALAHAFSDYYSRHFPKEVIEKIVEEVAEECDAFHENEWTDEMIARAMARNMLPEEWWAY